MKTHKISLLAVILLLLVAVTACGGDGSGADTTEAPAVTTTEAPAVTTTEAPAVTTTEAPAVTTTKAPAVTTTVTTAAVTTTKAPTVTTTVPAATTAKEPQKPVQIYVPKGDAPQLDGERDAIYSDGGVPCGINVFYAADYPELMGTATNNTSTAYFSWDGEYVYVFIETVDPDGLIKCADEYMLEENPYRSECTELWYRFGSKPAARGDAKKIGADAFGRKYFASAKEKSAFFDSIGYYAKADTEAGVYTIELKIPAKDESGKAAVSGDSLWVSLELSDLMEVVVPYNGSNAARAFKQQSTGWATDMQSGYTELILGEDATGVSLDGKRDSFYDEGFSFESLRGGTEPMGKSYVVNNGEYIYIYTEVTAESFYNFSDNDKERIRLCFTYDKADLDKKMNKITVAEITYGGTVSIINGDSENAYVFADEVKVAVSGYNEETNTYAVEMAIPAKKNDGTPLQAGDDMYMLLLVGYQTDDGVTGAIAWSGGYWYDNFSYTAGKMQ